MKMLYFDLSMGAAGDMLTAALLRLFDDPDGVCAELNALGIPGVRYVLERSDKCGIAGLHMRVEVYGVAEGEEGAAEHVRHHDHHHATLASIASIIDGLDVPPTVRAAAQDIFGSLAEAEASVHGSPIDQIHFHEVGTVDAVADVVAASYLIYKIAPDAIFASAMATGSGTVRCAHGVLPVPVPATAWLLGGIPAYAGSIPGELCTPTGAAIIRHFVERFEPMPPMTIERVGYGMGTKDFPQANCLRAFMGDGVDTAGAHGETAASISPCEAIAPNDHVVELSCNIDDMTGEALGFALEALIEAGALDAWATPIIMKKSRPAYQLSVLCAPDSEARMVQELFEVTTTIGIRRRLLDRYTLHREVREARTGFGTVRVKEATGSGVHRMKPEFDDIAQLAAANGLSVDAMRALVEKEL